MDFRKILNFINPHPEIGGLEINDGYLRFASIKGKKTKFFSLKLPPKIVEDGKVKDKNRLFSIISDFHNQITSGKKKKIYSIISVSDANIYTEIFSVPKSASANLEEAANLNLQMISPIDFNAAYSDWQLLGEKNLDGAAQMEFLGAFVPKTIIDDFEDVLTKAGFEVVAIEFPALAIVKSLSELGEGVFKGENYLLFRIESDGLAFGLIKNGDLYFLHFVSWSSAYGEERNVSFESLKNLIISEIQKVLSFYETHWGGSLNNLLLITPTLTKEISKIISENFPGISLQIPALKTFKNLTSSWFSVLGTALRGTVPRSKDNLISLAAAGTEEKFKYYETISFIKLWRSVVLTFLSVILIFFALLDVIFSNNLNQLNSKLGELYLNPQINKLNELKSEAESFNQKSSLLYKAYQERIKWSLFLKKINSLANNDAAIKRIFIQSPDSPVLLIGEASSEESIIKFKNALESQPNFSNINFQLSNITQSIGGKTGFSISFNVNVKNLE